MYLNIKNRGFAKERGEGGRERKREGGRYRERTYHFEVWAFRKQITQDNEQKVAVNAPLVNFIDKDVRDAREHWVALEAAQQNSCRAEEQSRRLTRAPLEADLIANGVADSLTTLTSNAFGNANGAYSARLRADNAAGIASTGRQSMVEHELWHLRSLTTSCLAANDDNLW
jgi:hypothetical protein